MRFVRQISFLFSVCALIGISKAFSTTTGTPTTFVPSSPPWRRVRGHHLTLTYLHQSAEDENEPYIVKRISNLFGCVCVGSTLAFNVHVTASAASVVPPSSLDVVGWSSSTELVAAEIKTMDMTLPSYSSISDAKNTQESLSTLVMEDTKPPVGKSSPKAKRGSSSMKGPSLSSVLPSMSKEGPRGKKVPNKAAKVETTNRDNEQQEDDIRSEKIQIVDMDMPSYSGATDSKAKSPFAL